MASKDDIGRVAYSPYFKVLSCKECGHIVFPDFNYFCPKCGENLRSIAARKTYQYIEETITKRRFIFWKVKETVVVKKFVGWQIKGK